MGRRCVAVCAVIGVFGVMAMTACMARAQDATMSNDGKAVVTFKAGDRAVFRYRYADVGFKPYCQELFSPQGVSVVRDKVPDHIHHHGLMFAIAVDGVDFWAEAENCGHEVQKSLNESGGNRLTQMLDWVRPGGAEVLLKEQRTLRLDSLPNVPVSLLTWQSVLEAPEGKDSVTLTGSHYFGLGMRFAQAMDAIGEFSNASGQPGEIVRGEERNVPANWCAYTAAPDGKPVTVAGFSHPQNARHPATWFTMAKPFAYLSATLNLHKEPLKLAAKQPLVLRYGVAVWDGKIDRAQIEQVYARWAALPAPDLIR